MNREQYQEQITYIQQLIDEKQYQVANEKLEKLYQYKPVRLSWFHLKGQLEMNSTGVRQKYYDTISGKYSYICKYQGIEECIRESEKISLERKMPYEVRRYQYLSKMINGDYSFFEAAMQVFTQSFKNPWPKYMEIYAMGEYVIYELQRNFHIKMYPDKANWSCFKWIKNLPNMGYWNEILNEPEEKYVVVVESKDNALMVKWICHMLQELGKKVFVIKKAICYQDDKLEIQQTVTISLGNLKETKNIVEIVPIEIVRSSGEVQSNIEYILRYLYKKYTKENGMHILASGWQTEELCLGQNGEIRSFRISAYTSDLLERTFALSFYGEYLTYISKIYQEDCKILLNQPTTKKFSIVIPARNSAYTLEHTIRTCLEQNYKGDYEIVISDNSTGNNQEVYELCEQLNDSRIVYIKTPRELHLPKSFEYAYLHTKGEYVLALGSDDGLLPWALEILDAVTNTYPNEKIIQWERGFYAWPGFNGGQQHQFIIPGDYKKGQLHLFYRERKIYLDSVMENPQNMYILPMLYINSCFKREYMYDILQKTGRLWDGICQDIYMGVVTAIINPKILNMRYPLSIAGMSSGSVGANANKGIMKDAEFKNVVVRSQMDNNVGGFCATYMEGLVPDMGTDVNSLYSSLLRMVSIGALLEEELWEKLDWQKVYRDLYQWMNVKDILFDKKINGMRYTASKHGEKFLQWFDEEIYNPALEQSLFDEKITKKSQAGKTYIEGELEGGGYILDASTRGVSNIYEAVLLFEEITNL